MLVLGSLLATLSGILYSIAALLQKHEGMQPLPANSGAWLLASLARRPVWLLSLAISAVAWVAEAASFALAPLVTAATLRNAGRGLLIVGGARWLKERFSRYELAGVCLTGVGGVLTAMAGAQGLTNRRPLSNGAQLLAAVACISLALGMVRASLVLWRKDGTGEGTALHSGSGVILGVAVGALFAGTGIFTKELSDRVALYGLDAVARISASPAPWLMIGMAIWAQSLLQQAFQRANTATVSSAAASTAILGLLLAGFILYGEQPGGLSSTVLLLCGVGLSVSGTLLLVAAKPAAHRAEPGT